MAIFSIAHAWTKYHWKDTHAQDEILEKKYYGKNNNKITQYGFSTNDNSIIAGKKETSSVKKMEKKN